MALLNQQRFLTRYFRDESFRTQVHDKGIADAGLEVDKVDIEFLEALSLDDLDRAALSVRQERVSKRAAEFEPFIRHLGLHFGVQDFLDEFDRQYTTGLQARPMEVDRFVSFALRALAQLGLPDYLADLLRFSYETTVLADRPIVVPDNAVDTFPDPLEAAHVVQLRQPFRIRQYSYDVVTIASTDASESTGTWPTTPTTLLLQKNWDVPKRTRAFPVLRGALLTHLAESGQVQILELLAVPVGTFSDVISTLESLHAMGVIAVSVPPHLRVTRNDSQTSSSS